MLADESGAVYGGVPHVLCVQVHRPVQQSLANAKVSARQQCVYYEGPIGLAKKSTANQLKEHNAEKNTQWITTLSLIMRFYLHMFSCCCLTNLRNCAKFSKNVNL